MSRGTAACLSCGTRFRSTTLAAILSMGLPGAGHIYLRRRILGSLEMAGGLAILAFALFRLGTVFLEVLGEKAPPRDLLRVCVPWALIIGAYSIASGLFTWMASRRRLVPVRPAGPAG